MNSAVTLGMTLLTVLPAVSCAQDRSAEQRHQIRAAKTAADRRNSGTGDHQSAGSNASRRLESVTWNSVKHELTWVISKGEKKEGASYKAAGSDSYLINMDGATMSFSGETRRFSREEASNVHVLMDLIAKYAVDSTVWWDDGQGEPVDGNGKPLKTPEKRRDRERDRNRDDDVPTLHVSWGGTGNPASTAAARAAMIRQLEQRLREIKGQDTAGQAHIRLTSYTPEKY